MAPTIASQQPEAGVKNEVDKTEIPILDNARQSELKDTETTKAIKDDQNNDSETDAPVDKTLPRLIRRRSSCSSIESEYIHRRPVNVQYNYQPDRPYNRRRDYSPSPYHIDQNGVRRKPSSQITSSSHLLERVNNFDGVAELPFPARRNMYLTTYPFTDKDVKKWSWLFSLNVEDTFLESRGRSRRVGADSDSEDGGLQAYKPSRRRRPISPYMLGNTLDLPSVYLSRALDETVVPDDTEDVTFFTITQNRHQPNGSKLLTTESRKATAMTMFYEVLKGDSVLFVGAVVGMGKKTVHPSKFKHVKSVDAAKAAQADGFVGVIC